MYLSNMFKISIVSCLILIALSHSTPYKKIIHETIEQAKCLDGSPPALYIHQGSEKDKILIFLEGGGLCQGKTISEVIEQCYDRTKNILGSSKYWPQQMQGQGYLSTNPQNNQFAEWTKIILIYCDGSLHQGHRDNPINYKGINLYFRGQKIIESQLTYIQNNYNLSQASKVIWTGGSAGAVGAYLWMNRVKNMVKNPDNVYTILDSGIFMDLPHHSTGTFTFRKQIQNLYKVANLDRSTPFNQCNKALQNQPWKCLLFQYNHPFLKGNLLIIDSQYDSWGIYNILGIKCLSSTIPSSLDKCSKKQLSSIEKYREEYQKTISMAFLQNTNTNYWSPSCSGHVYACLDLIYDNQKYQIPALSGVTVRKSVTDFVLKNITRASHVDSEPWPSNQPCSKPI